MANKKINKNLTRSLVALGTICAGAVIWGSVSGQFQSAPLAAQETAAVLPDSALSSGVKLDSTLTPSIAGSSSPSALQTVPTVAPGPAPTTTAASTASTVASQPAVTTLPPVVSQPVVTPPAATVAKPVVTVAPPAVVMTAPKLRTRGS